MYMLYMHFYVHMVLCACCTYGAMYILCCVNDCRSGAVGMWCYGHVVPCICCICGAVCRW